MPPPLARRPRLQHRDLPYREAFLVVHSARSYHMGGANAVPVSEVLAYMQLVGIASATERVKYLRIVQRLDSVYLTYQSEKAAKTTA